MKKVIISMLLLAVTTSMFAQFEQGKKYVNASLTGLDLSYSDLKDISLGLDANAGYFIEQDWMVVGSFGFDFSNSDLNSIYIGAKGRYYIEQNGLYLAAGLKYLHMKKNINDIQLTPEVGYCYFLNQYITVEPAAYFDMSMTDFGHKSRIGVKLGVGIYF